MSAWAAGWAGGQLLCTPTSQACHAVPLLRRNNVGLSAVCAYNLSTAEAVFSGGKYMQSATVEQSHTKWVRYNGAVPTPRPGAVSGAGLREAGGRLVAAAVRPRARPGWGWPWRGRGIHGD